MNPNTVQLIIDLAQSFSIIFLYILLRDKENKT